MEIFPMIMGIAAGAMILFILVASVAMEVQALFRGERERLPEDESEENNE